MFTPRREALNPQERNSKQKKDLEREDEERCLVPNPPLSDAYSQCLWHLDADTSFRYKGVDPTLDINIDDVWEITKGEGVHALVVEYAAYALHEDLVDNFDMSESDMNGHGMGNAHGTTVAGIIGARDNDIGGRGVAPRVTLIQFSRTDGGTRYSEGFAFNKEIVAVSSHSYGWSHASRPFLSR